MTNATTKKPTAKKRKATATTKKKKPPSPAKKRKTTATTTPQQSSPILSLPYDLLFNCLARVSRLYYPTLSLVSKSFRSLLASPELYRARSLLGRTESCLYVCIGGFPDCRWFTLCRKPHGLLTSGYTCTRATSSGYVLAAVPSPQDPQKRDPVFPGLVAVGSNIYNIGPRSPLTHNFSHTISILDCCSHTWHDAPCLQVKMTSFSASVLDQKIYVAGCCKDGDSNSYKNLMEVFDTKTQTWDPKPIPCSETFGGLFCNTACLDGKFHVMRDDDVVAYNSKEGRWDRVEKQIGRYIYSKSYCEIHNVLYSCDHGNIVWYDTEAREWRELKGLVGLPEFPSDKKGIRLADYGGKMAVLWLEEWPFNFYGLRKMIWCAEITLEKRKSGEIWGKVEWFDHLLTIPTCEGKVEWFDHLLTIPTCEILKVLAATV
ncbi:F-box-like domain superfamily [Arabidopsis suecica]|uniref:F-box-like domain superfamily n=1 Tax=Arabidopsis suecica TaxID=45249 RepID=A0A8T2CMR4_ARASU|nr:F-box-like domain superfamily [Arabidopsis suecica]